MGNTAIKNGSRRQRERASSGLLRSQAAPKIAATEPTGLRFSAALWAVVLLCLVGALYLPVCRFDFVSLDDNIHIYQNPNLNPPSSAHLSALWRAPYENLYIPVTYTLWTLLSSAARLAEPRIIFAGDPATLDPHLFHIANLCVHLTTTLLVFLLLRRLVRGDVGAFCGALVFGGHPGQVESVAWISEMKGLLCGLFGVLSLLLYVYSARAERASTRRWLYGAATLSFLLAMLAKPTAVVLPIVAGIIDLFLVGRPFKTVLKPISLWLAISAAFTIVAHQAQPLLHSGVSSPLPYRPLVAMDALAFYLGKLAIPIRLSVDYGRTPQFVIAHALTWLEGIGTVGLLTALVVLGRKRWPWLSASVLIFVAGVLPVLGLVPFIYQQFSTVADRYFYLAMLGPALATTWIMSNTTGQKSRSLQFVGPKVLVGSWIVGCLALTALQVPVWRNNITLYEHGTAINPNSWLLNDNLASAYGKVGDHSQAIAAANRALREQANDSTYLQVGIQYGRNGQPDLAIPYLRKSMDMKPDSDSITNLARAECDLAVQEAKAGKLDQAIANWTDSIRVKPDFSDGHYNLGAALDMQGKHAAAIDEYRAALRCDPNNASARAALQKTGLEPNG